MQRAASSPASSPLAHTPSASISDSSSRPAKRQKHNPSTTPTATASDGAHGSPRAHDHAPDPTSILQDTVNAAAAERDAILARQAAAAGDTKWTLHDAGASDLVRPHAPARAKSWTVLRASYGELDSPRRRIAAGPLPTGSGSEEEDVVGGGEERRTGGSSTSGSAGRRSFGQFRDGKREVSERASSLTARPDRTCDPLTRPGCSRHARSMSSRGARAQTERMHRTRQFLHHRTPTPTPMPTAAIRPRPRPNCARAGLRARRNLEPRPRGSRTGGGARRSS